MIVKKNSCQWQSTRRSLDIDLGFIAININIDIDFIAAIINMIKEFKATMVLTRKQIKQRSGKLKIKILVELNKKLE